MRILYIAPRLQHPTLRGPTRCYHFIKELSKRHSITLLTLKTSSPSPAAMEEMNSYTEKTLILDAAANSDIPDERKINAASIIAQKIKGILTFRKVVKEMRRTFLHLVREGSFDVVLFHGKSVASIIEDWNELPIVIDFCDATSMRIRMRLRLAKGIKRFSLLWRYLEMRKKEKKLLRKSPHLAFISSRDRDAILSNYDHSVGIVPIGVDLDFWTRKTKRVRRNCIVFTGVMNYGPNEDAALYLINHILPLVRPKIADLEVLIVGRDPSSELLEQANRFSDVTVTGFVDDVRTYLERAALFVAPLRYASGIQNKVLEALAMNLPVICTTPAAEGLYFDDYKNPPVRVKDGSKAFAAGIVDLLGDEHELNRLADDGRRFVQSRFDWAKNAYVLEKMLVDAVENDTHVYKQSIN